MTPGAQRRRWRRLGLAALAAVVPAAAQEGPPEMPPMPVRFTAAITAEVRGTVELSGTIRSRRASVVASEVEGVVVELAARQGDRVRRGAPLVKLRTVTARLRLRAAEGELKEAQARLELAVAARDRARQLAAERIISDEQLDARVAEFDASVGRVERLEAEVARLTDQLERTVVRAPFAGVVTRERVAPGEWISAGGAVVELVDTGDLELELDVPEGLVAGVATGEPVAVVFDALAGVEFSGRVRAVVPSARSQARTFPVLIEIANAEGRIGVGMLGRARLAVGEPRPEVMVPKDAVVSRPRGDVVYLLDDDDRVNPVPVETGGARGGWIAVRGAIAAGARVVTLGNERLAPGQQVDPQAAEYDRP